jgi:DNA-binding transcriptional regulator LsrR (DeoR family)
MYTEDIYSSSHEREHIELLLSIARKYYLEGDSQAEIATAVNFSRPSVSRLLTEARRRGIVQIQISHPLERLTRLEDQLAETFGLTKVRVADSTYDAGEVVRCAAALLVESCREDSLITVSNGHSVAATVNAVPRMHWTRSQVVQMVGTLGHHHRISDSAEVCRRLAHRLGGSFHELPVPFFLSSGSIAAQMRREEPIAAALALGGGADVALVEVGAVHMNMNQAGDVYPNPEIIVEMARTGAVGHIVGHFVSGDGRHLVTPLCERAITVDLEQVKAIPMVIAVAWGLEKIQALKAVMKGRFISALVTDRSTAEELLAQHHC